MTNSLFANGSCISTNDIGIVRTYRETTNAGMLGVNIGVFTPTAFSLFPERNSLFYVDLLMHTEMDYNSIIIKN